MSNGEKDPNLPPGLDDIDAFFRSVVSGSDAPAENVQELAQPRENSELKTEQLHIQEVFMTELVANMIHVDSTSHPEEQARRLWEQFPNIIRNSAEIQLQRKEANNADAIKQVTLERLAQFTDRRAEDWGRRVGSSFGTPNHARNERTADRWARYNTVAQAALRMEQQGRPRPQQQ